MANNSQQPSGMQFRPVIQAQQGQQFVPMTSQQFGHAAPCSNVGMPVVQSQQLQYSKPKQQLTPIPIQPSHPLSSLQAMPMPYIQTSRPLNSVPPYAQQAVPHISNHMPGLTVSGATPHSSYTFTPSYGQQQDNANALPQYPHPPQMLAPPAGQPWSSVSQSVATVTSVKPAGVQSSCTTSTDTDRDAILHDVIDICDDDDSDDLVIIGEKVSKSNKGKTIEAIHQVVDVSDYMFFQPGIECDLGLKKSTYKNSPGYDTQSGFKNSHVTDSSQSSWSLEPCNSKIQGSTRAILHDVIDIGDDDDSDDLVIIGEKVSKSNKGKTIEAIHQAMDVSDYMFFQPGVEYDLGLKRSTYKNFPWYDTQSGFKNSHVTDSSQPSWSLEPSNSKILGSTRVSSSNLQIKMDNVDHSFGTELSSQLFSQAAPSKKKSAASLHSDRGLNLSLGVKSSNSERLLKSSCSKMKSASLAGNPEARKLLHASKPPAAPKFKSAKKAGGSSSSYHANFKDEILRKFGSFKQFDIVSDTSDHFFVRDIYGFPLNLIREQRTKNWAKKIQKEWKILEKNLPDSIFVRIFESRMDLMRAVIIGAEGTPYHDGLFFFDIYLPGGFPNAPPRLYFHHRCGSSKLNPNLKPYGPVCLSILNTWDGSKNERWLPRVSTILQVLVSIQGLVLNTKPFFNQPTIFVRGTKQGESRSRCYNEEVCINSLWTMIHMIRRPPKNFEDFVVEHFLIRAHDILGACKAYMEGAQVGSLVKGGVQDGDEGDKSCTEQFKISLREPMEELVREFARIGAKDCEKFLCYKRTFSMKTQI